MRYLTLLSLTMCGWASEISPWITPPLEFHAIIEYEGCWQDKFQSPAGSFNQPGAVNNLETTLQVSPWPYWEGQLSIDFAGASFSQPFSYAAIRGFVRYQYLDDTVGDPFALVFGLYLESPRTPFITNNNFFYMGYLDIEGSVSIGKAFYPSDEEHWRWNTWGYLGCGIATKGSPWIQSYLNASYYLNHGLTFSLMARMNIGFGTHNVLATQPFPGYGSIGYRYIDLLPILEYEIQGLGTLGIWGFYNVYAVNTSQYYYGGGVSLEKAFSF